jgi:RNA polymerase sigma-70 factor, ECF subfamily
VGSTVQVTAGTLGRDAAAYPHVRLVEAAAGGDADAFDALLRPRLDRVFRLAVSILGSEADARDAVQEASLLAWRELPRLRSAERFDSWLSQIVVNQCRSSLRRTRGRRVREIAIDDSPPDDTAFVGDGPGVGSDEVELMQSAFTRLDGSMRALLVLHYIEERPIREIAAILAIPAGTVKWRLWRARRTLDRAMAEERR